MFGLGGEAVGSGLMEKSPPKVTGPGEAEMFVQVGLVLGFRIGLARPFRC